MRRSRALIDALASPFVSAVLVEALDWSVGGPAILARPRAGHRLSLPLLWSLAGWVALKRRFAGRRLATNTWLFDGFSDRCRAIREGAATWRALELIYAGVDDTRGWRPRLERFWLSIRNAEAARNRLVLCRQLLRGACRGRRLRLLSLASGSARALLEVAAELEQDGRLAEVRVLDIDPEATAVAQGRGLELGLSERLVTHTGNVLRFESALGDYRPDVIEMVGFLDYLRDATVRALIARILRRLRPGGVLLTAHIHPNVEAGFLESVVDWGVEPPMRYRTRSEFLELLVQAGAADVRAWTEPHRIHTLALVRSERGSGL